MEQAKRTILTEYRGYVGGNKRLITVQTTRSSNPNKAVQNCTGHMQVNEYGATVALVHDLETGELHAVIKRSVNGDLHMHFKRNPRDFVTADTLKFFDKKAARLLERMVA